MKKSKHIILAFAVALSSLAAHAAGPAGVVEKLFVQPRAGAVPRPMADKVSEVVSVTDFGVKCNGTGDDSQGVAKAVAALGAGTELVIPGDANCRVRSIQIAGKSDFVIRIDGKVTNIAAKPASAGVNANASQGGASPTFYIINASRFRIYGKGSINNGYREGFWIGENATTKTPAPCSDFDISVDILGNGTNDNLHANRIRYSSRFAFHDMHISAVGKKPAWVNASTAYYSDWVESLLVWDSTDFKIRGVTSTNGAMSGLYIGSNTERFEIADNDLEHNGGSGVQLAWSSFGSYPRNFVISNNRAKFNRADGYDLNNTGALIDVHGTMVGNLSYYNGWGTEDQAATAPTNDGSGIGTFINLKKMIVVGNTDIESARTGLFCVSCYDFTISSNIINKSAAASLGDGLYFDTGTNISAQGNSVNVIATRPALKLYSLTQNRNVKLQGNYLYGLIQFAGGGYEDTKFTGNQVLTTAQVTMPVDAVDNTFLVSGDGQNGLYVGASGITVERNRVTAPNFAIVAANVTDVALVGNTATGGNGGIRVDTVKNVRVSGNYGKGSSAPGIHVLGSSDRVEVSMNRAESTSGNSYRVESTCTNTNKWGNRSIVGPMQFDGTYGINY